MAAQALKTSTQWAEASRSLWASGQPGLPVRPASILLMVMIMMILLLEIGIENTDFVFVLIK